MGMNSRKGVTQGSSSFFYSRAVLPLSLTSLPNSGATQGRDGTRLQNLGGWPPCPIPAHTKGFLCPVEETQQCLEKPNREAKRKQGSFKTLWLPRKKEKKKS